ncbi:MAG: MBL fold metallo-hydrolase [Anaerolineae bacterium]|nr:MBL fold metallo-hydrolase [Anaerolineae bacterium]
MRARLLVSMLVVCLVGCGPRTTPAIPSPATVPTESPAAFPTATVTRAPTSTATLTPGPTATTVPSTATPVATFTATPNTQPMETRTVLTITVVYDNVANDARLQTDWGFACLVEGLEQPILFDTGGKGDILLRNIRALGLDPQAVRTVVLSHSHGDHTGGLAAFLAENPDVTVYVPHSFPAGLKDTVQRAGATLVEVTGPQEIGVGAHTTGELGSPIREQALALETSRGLVVITGCAHPGIATLVRQVKTELGGDVYLALGGFHLREANAAQIADTIAELQGLGVQRIAPSHCTGDAARRAFAEAFGTEYLESGLGQVFVIAAEE